jgi:hypothetical protein
VTVGNEAIDQPIREGCQRLENQAKVITAARGREAIPIVGNVIRNEIS